jgi:hypothetical protein
MKTTDFIKEDFVNDAAQAHQDHEVQMARADCYNAAKTAIELHRLLKNVTEQQGLDGWVSEKITLANDYLKSVTEYLRYEQMGSPSIVPEFDTSAATQALDSALGEGGIGTVKFPDDEGTHTGNQPIVRLGGTFDKRPQVKQGSLVKVSGLDGVWRVNDIRRDEAAITMEIPNTGKSMYVPLSDLRVWTNKPIKEQGVAEAIPYALSAANAAAEYQRQGNRHKGRIDIPVQSSEDYLAAGKALTKAARAAGQKIDYGLSDGVMSIFSDTMTADELDQFINDVLNQGVAEDKLNEFATGGATGSASIATTPGVGAGKKVGSLFGGSYQSKNPFTKKKKK